jgi:phosphate transport system substrate-binding protein
MQHASTLVKEVGYVPLPDEVYALAYKKFLNKKTGSMFVNTSTVGANLEKLLRESQ